MPIQSQQQLINRSEEIRTATEQYSITEQQVGQLFIDIIDTSFANIPEGLSASEIKALLLQNADTYLLTGELLAKLNNVPTNTTTALAGKENTGVAQNLIDGLKDGVSFSGDTLNKLYNLVSGNTVAINTKVFTGDTRLTDQRTPTNNSVSTDKIQNSAVTEVKLSSEVRDKLNQVSGATGYDSNSFDADFADKTTDQLTQGTTNLYFTTAEKTKLAGIESGATADMTATEIESAYESRPNTNKYTDTDKSKVDNVPTNTITSLAGKENTGVAQTLINQLKDSVPTSADTLNKISVTLNQKVNTNDTRLTDERTPLSGSVTTGKIQDGAVTAAKIALSGITINRLSSTVQDTLNSVAGKENTGVAQTLIDNLIDGAPTSGNTLNKLNITVNGKVSNSDPRLTDERTPLSGSVTTAKIADGAVTNDKIANSTIEEAKLSSAIRDKLNQVSGATGYNSASFNADFSGKTTDDLQQGVSNLYLTDNSVTTAKVQDSAITEVKLSSGVRDILNQMSGVTGYDSSNFNADFSDKTTDELTEGSINLYMSDVEKAKLVNVPDDTINELAGKADIDDERLSDERTPLSGSVSTEKIQASAVTFEKLSTSVQDTLNTVALKENTGVAQTLINQLKDNVPVSGNTLSKLNTLINQNSQSLSSKADSDDPRLSDERTPVDNSVSTAKIQDEAITNAKIADDTIEETKLSVELQEKINFTIIDGGTPYD